MQILIDMNLSPLWVEYLERHGHRVTHWRSIGAPNAPDTELMAWARANNHIVLTEDLDFTHLIALTEARGPSIFQVRTMDNFPEVIGHTVLAALAQFQELLKNGAIVVLDQRRARARVLPLRK